MSRSASPVPQVPLSRDHPDYPWHHRPADHSVAGLFVHGPQEAGGALARMIAPTHCHEPAPPPVVARAQQEIRRRRAEHSAAGLRKLLAAIGGARTRNRRAVTQRSAA